MDRYLYLGIGLGFLLPWTAGFLLRSDLRPRLWKSSLLGAILGVGSEYWYLRDYWHPPSIMGTGNPWLEDLLFGFAVAGVSVTIFDAVFSHRSVPRSYDGITLGWFSVCGLILLLLGTDVLHGNSIFVTSAIFLLFALFMGLRRRDLLPRSLFSGAALVLLMLPIYLVLFGVFSSGYWDQYWLLAPTPYGIMFFRAIPLTEILWYFSWGAFASILPPFAAKAA